MQLSSPNHHHKLNQGRTASFEQFEMFCSKKLISPCPIPNRIAMLGSYLAISLIFLFDVLTGPAIAFQLIYIFPLAFIALHTSRARVIAGAALLALFLQMAVLITFQHQAILPLFLIIVFSNSIVVLVTHYFRLNLLGALRLSTIDPLTQLGNRRALDIAIDDELKRQSRNGGHLSVALLDLDGFKGLNDTMGHETGDRALLLVADILRGLTRQTDTVVRLGGDEFVIVMPNTSTENCNSLCHRFCHTIRIRMMEELSYPITASIGFTTIEDSAEMASDILEMADKAMYQSKANGKNSVVGEHGK